MSNGANMGVHWLEAEIKLTLGGKYERGKLVSAR